MLLKKSSITYIIDFFVLFFFVVSSIIIVFNKSNINLIYQLSLIVLASCLIANFKKNKNDFLVLLFFISNFVFLNGRLLISIVKKIPLKGMYFAPYIFTDETVLFMAQVLFFNNFGIFLGRTIGNYIIKDNIKKNKKIYIKIKKIYILIIIIFLFSIIYTINLIIIVNKLGYLAKFNGVTEKSSIWMGKLHIVVNFFNPLIFTYLSVFNKEDFKNKKKVIILFFINSLLMSLTGGRGVIIYSIFFLLWYVYKYYNLKINLIKLAILGIALISFSFYISSRRTLDEKETFRIANFEKIYDFLNEQGGSISHIGYYKDYPQIKVKNKPMIFSFILGGPEKLINKVKGQEYNYKESFYNGERVSSIINEELFKKGHGAGGNYLIEMLEIGGCGGVLFFSMIYTLSLQYIQIKLKEYNLLIRVLFLTFIYRSFMAPRAHYLTIGVLDLVGLFVIYIFLKFVGKDKLNNEKNNFQNI